MPVELIGLLIQARGFYGMLDQEDVLEILDYVENFEQKNIQFVMLCTTIRSGVTFVHSLLDNHPQILQLPICLYPYYSWDYAVKYAPLETLEEEFLKKSIGSTLPPLGENQDIIIDLPWEEIYGAMKQMKAFLGVLTRKKLILLLHFVYAKLMGIDLSNVRVLLFEHHAMPTLFGYFAYVLLRRQLFTAQQLESLLGLTPQVYTQRMDAILKEVLSDFPNVKFLISIRQPMAALFSTIQQRRTMDPQLQLKELGPFYACFYQVLMGYYSLYPLKQRLGDQVCLLRIEDLHGQPERVMRDVASFLEVDFQESLLVSTFCGYLWAGNEATGKSIFGPDPDFEARNNRWCTEWDADTQAFCLSLCNPLARLFGYAPSPTANPQLDMEVFSPLEATTYRQFPVYLIESLTRVAQQLDPFPQEARVVSSEVLETFRYNADLVQQRLQFWVEYPDLRRKTLQYLFQVISELQAAPPLFSSVPILSSRF